MADSATTSGWRRFWEKGGWWRAVLLVVVYYALYQLLPLVLIGPWAGGVTDDAGLILVGTAAPIAIGVLLLLAFALSVGWLRELFQRQPIRGGWWMWIAVAVVLLFNVLHFASIDYGKAGAGVVVAWLVSGLFIGIAEETLTRGFVVNLMRKAGHREIAVALVSAALFAFLHAGNLITGQALVPTLLQLLYTFGFGLCMYLALRVTGNLIWPILLHASTDPSIFLATLYPDGSAIGGIAGLGNFFVIGTGLILLIFIRGRVQRPAEGVAPATQLP